MKDWIAMLKVQHDGQKWAVDKSNLEGFDANSVLHLALDVAMLTRQLNPSNVGRVLNTLEEFGSTDFAQYLADRYNAAQDKLDA